MNSINTVIDEIALGKKFNFQIANNHFNILASKKFIKTDRTDVRCTINDIDVRTDVR